MTHQDGSAADPGAVAPTGPAQALLAPPGTLARPTKSSWRSRATPTGVAYLRTFREPIGRD